MTREQLIKHWDVIKAFKEGKEIQYKDIFTKEFEDIDEPYFKLNVEYRIKPTPQKRLPTIEEVEKWFMGNRVFKCINSNGGFYRIEVLWREDKEIRIGETNIFIKQFCEDFTHYNGSELYITE